MFGNNLAATQQSATAPYPTMLGGTTATINGTAAPPLFVSPGQVNFQMPSTVANSQWFNIKSATVVVSTAGGIEYPGHVRTRIAAGFVYS